MMSEPNLRTLKASRTSLKPGDIFVMQVPMGAFLFGRVILTDLPRESAPMPKSNLIYIYRAMSILPDPDLVELVPEDLLVPPEFTNRLGWTKGYFQTVANRPIKPTDLLRQHCFRRWTGDYVDERGRPLPGPVEPCGEWGLSSYALIDDLVSDALRIPRAAT